MIWDLAPEVFSFSPVPRWYSICFAIGLVTGHLITRKMMPLKKIGVDIYNTGFTYVVIGMMVGMRLGHCLFYQPEHYLVRPWEILMIWQGGYASHGGFVGVFVALYLFMRKHRDLSFWWLMDRAAVGCMNVAGWIRIGNFFNSEMVGRETDVPWAVTFSLVDTVPRHPTQLYEAVGYFVICFIGWRMFFKTKISESPGKLFGLVTALAPVWRVFCEFFKVDQVGFEQGMTLNMGQLLSIPFFIAGAYLYFRKAPADDLVHETGAVSHTKSKKKR